MAMGMKGMAAGGLLSGIIQGLEQGKQRAVDIQHKKDLLKLEQSKIKLLEDEQRLKSEQGPDIRSMFMETGAGIFGKGKGDSEYGILPNTQPPGKTGSLKDTLIETPWGLYESLPKGGIKLLVGKPEEEPREIKLANKIVAESNARGIPVNIDEVIMKLAQGGAGTSLEEKLTLSLAPWMLLGKSKEAQDLIRQLVEEEKRGKGTTLKNDGTDKKDDWRNYLPGSKK